MFCSAEASRSVITFFATAKPFRGHVGIIQRNALKSWTLLHPDAEVILFGDDEGASEACRELGLRHEPEVLRTNNGTKRLDFIFERAQELARHDTLCYANCDIILTHQFLAAQQRLQAWQPKYLMVGRRWDTDVAEPLNFSAADWQERIVERAKAEGIQRFYHNIDYFLFPRGLYREIPPLVIGRIWWDHWLVGKAHSLGVVVVDVSEVVCAVHQNHDYGYHPQGIEGVCQDKEARTNYQLATQDTKLGTIEDASFRLTQAGIVENLFYWLAPAKRRFREMSRKVRSVGRTRFWHPLLTLTRPIRHAFGLKRSSVPPRGRIRKHWMDQ
jgi:hypothetical protein